MVEFLGFGVEYKQSLVISIFSIKKPRPKWAGVYDFELCNPYYEINARS